MVYAGFWPRFAALWLDLLFLSPVILLLWWGAEHFRLFPLYYLVPGMALELYYSVYLVRRFGGTPGKRVMRVHIRKVDGSPVTYREAVLRYLPDWLLARLSGVVMILAVLHLTDAEYLAVPFQKRLDLVTAAEPPWSGAVTAATHLWTWGEFIVMMTNRNRRALHDFLAGTVVVRDETV
jgi:uncharacterized RDD family membrane protein YckC